MPTFRFVQLFFNSYLTPCCDKCEVAGVTTKAVASFQDADHNPLYLCDAHRNEMNLEIPEGIEYAPTNLRVSGYCIYDGHVMSQAEADRLRKIAARDAEQPSVVTMPPSTPASSSSASSPSFCDEDDEKDEDDAELDEDDEMDVED